MTWSKYEDKPSYRAMTGQPALRSERAQWYGNYDGAFGGKRSRSVGVGLKPREVPALVAAALASGGPIAQGDAFEHLLVVMSDHTHMHMYHFIVAEPKRSGGQRRVVMLTERTVHVSCDLKQRPRTREFAQKVVAYAAELGAPRVLVSEPMVSYQLLWTLAHNMQWIDANAWGRSELAGSRYENDMAVAFECYSAASKFKQAQHPEAVDLDALRAATAIKPYEKSGLLEVVSSGKGMDRDLEAMCLAYHEYDVSRMPIFERASRVA